MRRPIRHSENGIGLVEILVAIGIFLVGVTAIVRIFPAGMSTVSSTANRTVASKIAESILSQYESRLDEVGAALLMYSGYDVHPDSTPDEPNPDTQTVSLNALDHVRQIRGERHTVDANGTIVLNFAPVVSGSVRVYRYLNATATPVTSWSSRDVNISGAAAGEYLSISYAWQDGTNTRYVENYRVLYQANPISLPPTAGAGTLAPSSIRVQREAIVSATLTSGTYTHGVISGLTTGQEVLIDYQVDDWRWVNEELTLYTNSGGQTEGSLLFQGIDASYDIRLVNLNTSATSSIPSTATTERDDDAGKILPSGLGAGVRLKVIYRTIEEWAVQVYRAPSQYVPGVAATNTLQAWQQYADNQWVGGSNQHLGFRASSAGRYVIVDYNYLNTSVTPNVLVSVRGELHRIPAEPELSPQYASFPYEVQLHHAYTEIVRVRGASVRARVYWNEDGTWRTVQIERAAPLRSG